VIRSGGGQIREEEVNAEGKKGRDGKREMKWGVQGGFGGGEGV